MLLQKLFLRIREFTPFQIVHDVEVFGGVVLEVHLVDEEIVWLRVIDDVSPVVIVCKHIFCRIHKHFNLVPHFYLQTDQRHVQFVIQDHADLFKLQTDKDLILERNSIKFIFDTGQIVELPFCDLLKIALSASLCLYACTN